ncbi:MAG: efflux RND transporter periplasmic adaptor subunit [Balneolales bacterium]
MKTATRNNIIIYLTLLLGGLALGFLLFSDQGDNNVSQSHDHDLEMSSENGVEVWTCSMHPSVREDEPGNCPICGMELIPASTEVTEDDYSMVMTEAAVQLANIQTTTVIEEIPTHEIRMPGRIKVDERRLTNITAHFPGRIRELYVDFTGAPIHAGEAMATIYSPELVTAQRELLTAIQHSGPQSAMAESSRQKLRQWELTDSQINEIIEKGEVRQNMEIVSPVDGYVITRNFAREDHVTQGAVLFEVVNLEQVWGVFEAYEEDLAWLQEGDSISFHSRANPGHQFETTVSYINPVVDPQKRTVQIRADIQNGATRLKPDMLISGTVRSNGSDGARKLIPASSVLWTGPRSVAFVKDTLADVPRFEAREIEVGHRTGDFYIIHNGLETGEEVVFNGAFRLDSEFQLADRFSMMNREPGRGAIPVHDHGNTQEQTEQDTDIEPHEEDHSGH